MAIVNNHILAETKNVKAVKKLIQKLHKRKIYEMCGLGLVWGAPGLGKTRTLMRIAMDKGSIIIKLDATTNQKSFILELRKLLSYKYKLSLSQSRKSTDTLFKECIDILNDHQTDIVVDEIDYAFNKKNLLGSIRDIVDDAPMTNVILIGMSEAYDSLRSANSHYFDRCNQFYHFKPLDISDTKLVVEKLSNANVPDKLIEKIHRDSGGVPRRIVKEIESFEAIKAN